MVEENISTNGRVGQANTPEYMVIISYYECMVPSNVGRASHTIMESVNVRLKSNVCVDKCIIRIFLRLSVIFRFSFPETGPFREPLNYLNVGRDTNGNIIMTYKCILNGYFFRFGVDELHEHYTEG